MEGCFVVASCSAADSFMKEHFCGRLRDPDSKVPVIGSAACYDISHRRSGLSVTLHFVSVDVHVVLMTDILVFMQEKDQKYIFPCLVGRSLFSKLFSRDIS